jgi:hypothetical protein
VTTTPSSPDVEPQRIGFLKRGRVGCSPDSFIGNDGLHEIKTKIPTSTHRGIAR